MLAVRPESQLKRLAHALGLGFSFLVFVLFGPFACGLLATGGGTSSGVKASRVGMIGPGPSSRASVGACSAATLSKSAIEVFLRCSSTKFAPHSLQVADSSKTVAPQTGHW